jgi:hypothetical protein
MDRKEGDKMFWFVLFPTILVGIFLVLYILTHWQDIISEETMEDDN